MPSCQVCVRSQPWDNQLFMEAIGEIYSNGLAALQHHMPNVNHKLCAKGRKDGLVVKNTGLGLQRSSF